MLHRSIFVDVFAEGLKRGEPLYEDLREKIRTSDVVHGDETSWRSDGVGLYVWSAGNENFVFF